MKPYGEDDTIDLKIVGQIISAIGMLNVFPAQKDIGEFLVPLIRGVPGCGSVRICSRGTSGPIGDFQEKICSNCTLYLEHQVEDPYTCGLVVQDKVRAYPLKTVVRSFGYIILTIDNRSQYDNYEPFIRNLGNALAIVLENRWQQEELQKANENLEQLVEERTAELLQSEKQLGLAQKLGQTGTWVYHLKTGSVLGSEETHRLFGIPFKAGELTIERMESCITDRERVHQALIDLIADDRQYDLEYLIRPADGSPPRRMHAIASLEKDANGNPYKILGFIQDITKRKLAEELLLESESLLRMAEQSAKLGGWSVDLEHNRVIWSNEVTVIHEVSAGFSPSVEEAIKFYAPEWREKITNVFNDCAQMGIPYDEEMEIITAKGRRVWVQTKGKAVKDDQGKITKVQGAIQDISNRKQNEAALRESQAFFFNAFNSSPLAKTISEISTGRYLEVNESFCRISGFDREEVVGRTSIEIGVLDQQERNLLLHELEQHGQISGLELHFRSKSGKSLVCRYSANLIGDKLFSTAEDITERKQAEQDLIESENRFRTLVEQAPIAIFIQTHGQFAYINLAGLNLFGAENEDLLIGKPVLERFPLAYREQVFSRIQKLNEQKEKVPTLEETIIKLDGSLVETEISAIPFYYKGDHGALVFIHDITERKVAEKALHASDQFNKSVLNSLTAHIAVLDENGVIVAVNEAWKKFARENASPDPEAYLGVNYLTICETAAQAGDEIASLVDLGIHAVLDGTRSQFSAEYSCDSPTQLRWFTVTVVPRHQTRNGAIIIHQDISDRKQAQQSLEASYEILKSTLDIEKQLARTDSLTGVHNRHHLQELAKQEFEISCRYQKPLSVLMVDIDHFKKFNDTYGHQIGDQMLKLITQAMVDQLRSADSIGRYGGDEFIILLPMSNMEAAYSLAERIQLAVAAVRVPTKKGDASVTLSIGIVENKYKSQTESVEEFFQRAEEAMYTAKDAGRNLIKNGN
ncbi:PAS domain S-box protein [Candidatus Villigracilis saccharophilus]|uniref:sensor domain-containing diguanylate cyclase n=1 Tax=Candidatus Villigracilis saccharophilus TaxID=3140684 RepID=UPI003137676B|nr:PAS domain S-box protein [Anaerolineales bacterium]